MPAVLAAGGVALGVDGRRTPDASRLSTVAVVVGTLVLVAFCVLSFVPTS
jgi:hypothetical protein